MPTVTWMLALMLAGPPVSAQAPASDPLQSPACRQALQALQAREAELAAAPPGPGPGPAGSAPMAAPAASTAQRSAAAAPVPPALRAARRQAAHACLGSRLDAPPPAGRLAQPPISVPPVSGNTTIPLPPRTPGASPQPQPLPRVPNAPLNTLTNCDATGCWTSDGTRLQRQGGGLLGPRGYCTTAGAVVTCP